jgi:DNA mismatch repair ATPase MutS
MQYQLRDGCILDSFGFNVLKLVQIRENICEKASQNMKILTDMSHAGKVDENEIDVQTFKNQTKNHNFKELIIKKSQKLAQELQKYDPNRDRDII